MTEFKDTLRAIKQRLSLSNSQMARYLGVQIGTYHQWLSGARTPSSATLRLVEVLELIEGFDPALHELLLPAPKDKS